MLPSVLLPHFSGDGDEDCEVFVKQVDVIQLFYGWTDRNTLLFAMLQLAGEAQEWCFAREFSCWNGVSGSLRAELLDRFSFDEARLLSLLREVRSELLQLTQTEAECHPPHSPPCCHECGQLGHFVLECPDLTTLPSAQPVTYNTTGTQGQSAAFRGFEPTLLDFAPSTPNSGDAGWQKFAASWPAAAICVHEEPLQSVVSNLDAAGLVSASLGTCSEQPPVSVDEWAAAAAADVHVEPEPPVFSFVELVGCAAETGISSQPPTAAEAIDQPHAAATTAAALLETFDLIDFTDPPSAATLSPLCLSADSPHLLDLDPPSLPSLDAAALLELEVESRQAAADSLPATPRAPLEPSDACEAVVVKELVCAAGAERWEHVAAAPAAANSSCVGADETSIAASLDAASLDAAAKAGAVYHVSEPPGDDSISGETSDLVCCFDSVVGIDVDEMSGNDAAAVKVAGRAHQPVLGSAQLPLLPSGENVWLSTPKTVKPVFDFPAERLCEPVVTLPHGSCRGKAVSFRRAKPPYRAARQGALRAVRLPSGKPRLSRVFVHFDHG